MGFGVFRWLPVSEKANRAIAERTVLVYALSGLNVHKIEGIEKAMGSDDSLKAYRKRRDFRKTPEPSGKEKGSARKPIFVIQKHDASRLHYDFRIQVGDILKSWAVPKGPSTDPRDKRLAVPTEDHPMGYADFEGVIPQGEYGGGTVMVWDTGTYKNIKEKDGKQVPMEKCVEDGHIMIWLDGRKIQGGYGLIRTGKDENARWLLVKMKIADAGKKRKKGRSGAGS
jgi:DNA ligase D-like protein (predicted 3'-phosphoesterase)